MAHNGLYVVLGRLKVNFRNYFTFKLIFSAENQTQRTVQFVSFDR